MPEMNRDPVNVFEKAFKEWKACFGGPRKRPLGQEGPDLSFAIRRSNAKEAMEKAFKEMVDKNNY